MKIHSPLVRLRTLGALGVALCASLAWAHFNARGRRAARDRESSVTLATARLVGGELALHAAARWLRHPTRSEPWAAASDAPAMLDVDPAGSTAPPPREVLVAGLPRHERVTLAIRRRSAP